MDTAEHVNAAMNIRRRQAMGFTLVEVSIVVCLVGLLAAIAVPSFIHARTESQKNICINNLKQIDAAIQQWALECNRPETAAVTSPNIIPYLKGSVVCPAGGTSFDDSYTIVTVATLPVCQRVPQSHVLPDAGSLTGAGSTGSGNGNGNGAGNGSGSGGGSGSAGGIGNGNHNGSGNGGGGGNGDVGGNGNGNGNAGSNGNGNGNGNGTGNGNANGLANGHS
jgi:prepilin-type N-terminal cleavage/methylation domain-containing protein